MPSNPRRRMRPLPVPPAQVAVPGTDVMASSTYDWENAPEPPGQTIYPSQLEVMLNQMLVEPVTGMGEIGRQLYTGETDLPTLAKQAYLGTGQFLEDLLTDPTRVAQERPGDIVMGALGLAGTAAAAPATAARLNALKFADETGAWTPLGHAMEQVQKERLALPGAFGNREFSEVPEGWGVNIQLGNSPFMGHEEVKIADVTRPGGALETAIFKTGAEPGSQPGWALGAQGYMEPTVSRLNTNARLGTPIPTAIHHFDPMSDTPGTLMEYIPQSSSIRSWGEFFGDDVDWARHHGAQALEDMRRGSMLDLLTSNADRRMGHNILSSDKFEGRYIPIDYGLAFSGSQHRIWSPLRRMAQAELTPTDRLRVQNFMDELGNDPYYEYQIGPARVEEFRNRAQQFLDEGYWGGNQSQFIQGGQMQMLPLGPGSEAFPSWADVTTGGGPSYAQIDMPHEVRALIEQELEPQVLGFDAPMPMIPLGYPMPPVQPVGVGGVWAGVPNIGGGLPAAPIPFPPAAPPLPPGGQIGPGDLFIQPHPNLQVDPALDFFFDPATRPPSSPPAIAGLPPSLFNALVEALGGDAPSIPGN